MNYYSSIYMLHLNITKKEAAIGSHSGACDNDISYLMRLPHIKKQLNKLDSDKLAKELKEYGAWDDEQLADHEENKARFLWIACGDIVDGNI